MAEYRALFSGQPISLVNLEVPLSSASTTDRRVWNHLMAEGRHHELAELVSTAKAQQAFSLNGDRPIVTEQTLLFIPHLSGWPGPDIVDLDSDIARCMLISHAHQSRGAGDPGRVIVLTTLSVYAPDKGAQHRHGLVEGAIAHEPRGDSGFSWDRIVQPVVGGMPCPRTFAEMNMNEKNSCSMRYLAVLSLSRQPFE